MRSHSVSSDIQGKLQIRIEFRAWRYIAFHQRNQSNAPVSKITLVLIVEATLHIYFRMYVFLLHPLQSQFILNEAVLLSFTSSASFCLHHRYRWKPWVPSQLSPPIGCFLSPSGGFLCSIDTDYSILLEILFFSFFFFFCDPELFVSWFSSYIAEHSFLITSNFLLCSLPCLNVHMLTCRVTTPLGSPLHYVCSSTVLIIRCLDCFQIQSSNLGSISVSYHYYQGRRKSWDVYYVIFQLEIL